MDNKNSKSESDVIREAENIINNYLTAREQSNIEKYYDLKSKYKKLKVLLITTGIALIVAVILPIIL